MGKHPSAKLHLAYVEERVDQTLIVALDFWYERMKLSSRLEGPGLSSDVNYYRFDVHLPF